MKKMLKIHIAKINKKGFVNKSKLRVNNLQKTVETRTREQINEAGKLLTKACNLICKS